MVETYLKLAISLQRKDINFFSCAEKKQTARAFPGVDILVGRRHAFAVLRHAHGHLCKSKHVCGAKPKLGSNVWVHTLPIKPIMHSFAHCVQDGGLGAAATLSQVM